MNKIAETTTALGLTQDDIDNIKEAFNKFADALIEVGKALAEAFQKVVEWVKGVLKKVNINKFICKAMLNGKEFHLSQHAKKARTRKKYRNLAYRRLCYEM